MQLGSPAWLHKRNVLPGLAGRVDPLGFDEYPKRGGAPPALPLGLARFLSGHAVISRAGAALYISEVTATAIEGLLRVDIAACRRLAMERGVQFRRRVLDVVG
jgi:hypothetical protein